MDTWRIFTARNDAFGIAEVANEIVSLANRLLSYFERAHTWVPAWELLKSSESLGRAVVQIPVGAEFFEEFFNSAVGYRAMFRRGPRIGSAANATLIDIVRSRLDGTMAESFQANLIRISANIPQFVGHRNVARSTFLRSLDPSLAKIWYATSEICSSRVRQLSFGISESKIDVGLEHPWRKIQQDPGDCIIEVKGAFVGSCGLSQVKDPELRAIGLSTTGGA